MNYVETPAFLADTERISDCNANEDCGDKEICIENLCRDNICEDGKWYNINQGECLDYTDCPMGNGSIPSIHHDSVCEDCEDGKFNTGYSHICLNPTVCNVTTEVEYKAEFDKAFNTICKPNLNCGKTLYQDVDICVKCDGFVPSPGVCQPFQTCDDAYYTKLPENWDGKTDRIHSAENLQFGRS